MPLRGISPTYLITQAVPTARLTLGDHTMPITKERLIGCVLAASRAQAGLEDMRSDLREFAQELELTAVMYPECASTLNTLAARMHRRAGMDVTSHTDIALIAAEARHYHITASANESAKRYQQARRSGIPGDLLPRRQISPAAQAARAPRVTLDVPYPHSYKTDPHGLVGNYDPQEPTVFDDPAFVSDPLGDEFNLSRPQAGAVSADGTPVQDVQYFRSQGYGEEELKAIFGEEGYRPPKTELESGDKAD
jgi:hypothetical protein